MNVEIGAEAALFPEKEYIKEIYFAVQGRTKIFCSVTTKEGTFHLYSLSPHLLNLNSQQGTTHL